MNDVIDLIIPKKYIDCYGHVHYKDYLQIFQNARRKFLARRGISLTGLERNKMLLVTRNLEISYICELLLGDKISISTSVSHIGNTSVIFQQDVIRNNCAVATCRQVFVLVNSNTRQKIAIPIKLRAKLLA